ncbi:MAG: DNA replication complex GINS family protein [Candidatus Thermoplasmatota archaeon]|jgi:DNA replication initiation complex subunit (GINS family)|nr:DNA replication complex GINS family protein [Candidatus Thermoplasmatota archaeon]
MTGDSRSRDEEDLIQRLGEVQAAEKASNSLTKIQDDFYERTSGHLRALLAELENCDPEQGRTPDELYYRLSERLKRARQILERIYATRERKIVLLALNQSRKSAPKGEDRGKNVNMLTDEADLFYTLKVDLETVRERLLKYDTSIRKQLTIPIETGIDTTTDDFVEETAREPDRAPQRQPMMKVTPSMDELVRGKGKKEVLRSASDNAPISAPTDQPISRSVRCPGGPEGTALVKALKDIDPFVLPDGTSITLRKDDIASLPEPVARVLMGSGLLALLGEVP